MPLKIHQRLFSAFPVSYFSSGQIIQRVLFGSKQLSVPPTARRDGGGGAHAHAVLMLMIYA